MSVARRVLATIQEYKMVSPGQKLLVAVSGGPDSMAMLHVLMRLKAELGIELHVFHLDHGFRGEESASDARFVADIARLWNLPCTVEKFDVPGYCKKNKLSKQEGAREVRYRLLSRVSAQLGAARVALAHHADDLAETMILNFLRGAGLAGLKGFLPVRDDFYVRPFFKLRRLDIEDYCDRHKLPYRVDSSNLSTVYTRNRVRWKLIPQLEEFNPALVTSLLRTSAVLREEDACLEEQAERVYSSAVSVAQNGGLVLDTGVLFQQQVAMKRRVLRKIWSNLTGDAGGPGFDHLEKILLLLQQGRGSWEVQLPRGVQVKRSYEFLYFKRDKEEDEEIPPYEYRLEVPGDVYVPEAGVTVRARLVSAASAGDPEMLPPGEVLLDFDRLNGELFVRRRRPGDRFAPLGLGGAKVKLKKFFIDHKVPREDRDKIPLVVTNGEIVWVAGLRPAEKYKVTPQSKRLLHLALLPSQVENEDCW